MKSEAIAKLKTQARNGLLGSNPHILLGLSTNHDNVIAMNSPRANAGA